MEQYSDPSQVIDAIAASHDIDPGGLWQAVADALLDAYLKTPNASQDVEVRIDPASFDIAVIAFDRNPQGVDVTPQDFGRIAARAFKYGLNDYVEQALRDRALRAVSGREGEVVQGVVKHVDARRAIVEVAGAEGVLPASGWIPGEALRRGTTIAALLVEVRKSGRDVILLSRTAEKFLPGLLQQIPAIADGSVLIHSVAREPGKRSKVVVEFSDRNRTDPVGLVIGSKGSTIQQVTRHLGDERLDVIAYSPDLTKFTADCLGVEASDVSVASSPSGDTFVVATVPSRLAARVVGPGGANVRLAQELIGAPIDVQVK